MPAMRCSLANLPEIDRVGEYPLTNPVASFFYRCPTHALHLYEYDGMVTIGGAEYRFKAGDITCTPAGVESSYVVDKPGRHWVIHFFDPLTDTTPAREIPAHIPLGKSHLFVLEQVKLIGQLFNGAKGAGARNSPPRLWETRRTLSPLMPISPPTPTACSMPWVGSPAGCRYK